MRLNGQSILGGSIEVAVEGLHFFQPGRLIVLPGLKGFLEHDHLVSQVGLLSGLAIGMIVADGITESGDAFGIKLGQLFLIVNPVGSEREGIGGESGVEIVWFHLRGKKRESGSYSPRERNCPVWFTQSNLVLFLIEYWFDGIKIPLVRRNSPSMELGGLLLC